MLRQIENKKRGIFYFFHQIEGKEKNIEKCREIEEKLRNEEFVNWPGYFDEFNNGFIKIVNEKGPIDDVEFQKGLVAAEIVLLARFLLQFCH